MRAECTRVFVQEQQQVSTYDAGAVDQHAKKLQEQLAKNLMRYKLQEWQVCKSRCCKSNSMNTDALRTTFVRGMLEVFYKDRSRSWNIIG